MLLCRPCLPSWVNGLNACVAAFETSFSYLIVVVVAVLGPLFFPTSLICWNLRAAHIVIHRVLSSSLLLVQFFSSFPFFTLTWTRSAFVVSSLNSPKSKYDAQRLSHVRWYTRAKLSSAREPQHKRDGEGKKERENKINNNDNNNAQNIIISFWSQGLQTFHISVCCIFFVSFSFSGPSLWNI